MRSTIVDMSRFPVETPRERVLAAAVDVIGGEGYERASLERIAAVADVSVEDVRRLVGDLETCALESVTWVNHRVFAMALEAFQGDGTWGERVCDTLVVVAKTFRAYPNVVRLGVLELPKLGAPGVERIATMREAYTAFLSEGVRPSEVLMAPAISELVSGGVFQVLRGIAENDAFDDLLTMLPDVVRAVLAPYCTPEEIERIVAARCAV